MFLRPPCTVASSALLLAVLALSGCAGDDHAPTRQTAMIAPQPAERSDPAETAFVGALDALALACEAFSPPQDRHSQPPTDDAFRQAAKDADGDPVKK